MAVRVTEALSECIIIIGCISIYLINVDLIGIILYNMK